MEGKGQMSIPIIFSLGLKILTDAAERAVVKIPIQCGEFDVSALWLVLSVTERRVAGMEPAHSRAMLARASRTTLVFPVCLPANYAQSTHLLGPTPYQRASEPRKIHLVGSD